MPAVKSTMSHLSRTKPAVAPYTKFPLISSAPVSIASSTTDRDDEVASSPARTEPPIPIKRGRGRPSKATLAAEAAFAKAAKSYTSGSEEPEEAYRRAKVAAGGFSANSNPAAKSSSKLSGGTRRETASEASGASEMDVDDSATLDVRPHSTRSSPQLPSESVQPDFDPTPLPNISESTRLPSEAPSTGSTESSAPALIVPRRKPVGRPPGIAGQKKQPAGAAAAAKKAAAKRKQRTLAAVEPNLEILVHNDPSIDLLVSYLSSPFADPLRLRPVSVMRTSTSSSSYTSYLFAVPKAKDHARGVVTIGMSSVVIDVPASTETGFGGERLALVVKAGEPKWVTVQ